MKFLITYVDRIERDEPQTAEVHASTALRAIDILKQDLGLITILSVEEKWS